LKPEMKKIRFGDLVQQAGRPTTMALWTAPEKNKDLQRAIRANRVLTIRHQTVGNKRDVGTIGFRKEPDAIYLIFPRSLPTADPAPVIGINYELLEQPPQSGKGQSKTPAQPTPSARTAIAEKRTEPQPTMTLRKFRFTVRAEVETDIEVQARSAKQARALALDTIQSKPLSPSEWRRAKGSAKIKRIAEARSPRDAPSQSGSPARIAL
jgi:hypothetical protein